MRNHTALGKREGKEGADGVEGDEPVRDAAEYGEQERRQERERIDALRINQAAATDGKRVRKIAVLRNRPAEARKISERGVRGETKNEDDGRDSGPVKPSAARDCAEQ